MINWKHDKEGFKAYTSLSTVLIFEEFSFVFSVNVLATLFKSTFNLSISSLSFDGRKTWSTFIVLASDRNPVTFLRIWTVKSDWFTTKFMVCNISSWNSSCPTERIIHPILWQKKTKEYKVSGTLQLTRNNMEVII